MIDPTMADPLGLRPDPPMAVYVCGYCRHTWNAPAPSYPHGAPTCPNCRREWRRDDGE